MEEIFHNMETKLVENFKSKIPNLLEFEFSFKPLSFDLSSPGVLSFWFRCATKKDDMYFSAKGQNIGNYDGAVSYNPKIIFRLNGAEIENEEKDNCYGWCHESYVDDIRAGAYDFSKEKEETDNENDNDNDDEENDEDEENQRIADLVELIFEEFQKLMDSLIPLRSLMISYKLD